MVTSTSGELHARGRWFYFWVAIACAAVAFLGFSGTYWLQLPAGTFTGSPLLHLHAALFSGWVLFFVLQTTLAANGDLRGHRAWGVAGVSLATAMVIIGVAAAIETLETGLAAGYGDRSRAFLLVPISSIAVFAAFVFAGLLNVSRPDWHKRSMVVATASLLQAAFARVIFTLVTGGGPGARPGIGPPPPPLMPLATGLFTAALLAICALYDWKTRGRPHPVYLIGAGAIIAVALLRGPMGDTPAWRSAADFLASFGR